MSFVVPRRDCDYGAPAGPPSSDFVARGPLEQRPHRWTASSQPSLHFFLDKVCCFDAACQAKIVKALNPKSVDDLILCCVEALGPRSLPGTAGRDRLSACLEDLKSFLASEKNAKGIREGALKRLPAGAPSNCSSQDSINSSSSSREVYPGFSVHSSPQSSQGGSFSPQEGLVGAPPGAPEGPPGGSFADQVKSIDACLLAEAPPLGSIGLEKEQRQVLAEQIIQFILKYLTDMQFVMLKVSRI